MKVIFSALRKTYPAESKIRKTRIRVLRRGLLICVASAGIFFSCIITPQPRETSPGFGAQGVGAQGVGASKPGMSGIGAVSSGASVSDPGTLPSETISQGIAPQGIPSEEIPQVAVAFRQPATEMTRSAAVLPPIGQGRVPVPDNIMGRGIVHPNEMASFLIYSNPGIERAFVENLAYIYTEESAVEGVNSDVAFAQMCLETGFLRFGGLVTADMNNFCGLGATGPVERGLSFANPRMGVRAHIQHLKAYASEEPLKQLLVDPRFHYVRRGSSPAISGLAGTWAVDLAYAEKIGNILERLYSFYYRY